MAETKAGKSGSSGCGKSKASTTKRRTTSSQAQAKKTPSKSALKQIAKDWEQVT